MKKIDWSKAPKGCIGAFRPAGDDCRKPFFVLTKAASDFQGRSGFVGVSADLNEYHVFTEYWTWVERAWTGEGLPPVGAECEACWASPCEYYQITVLAHDNGKAVYRWLTGPGAGELSEGDDRILGRLTGPHPKFRPIRTPEQIAVEEREKAIQKMVSRAGGRMSFRSICESLYDHGYRKQDKEK